MSARVCNPVAIGMSEIAKLRTPVVGRMPISKAKSMARVKRDLFGPVDKQESKKFIDRVLADHNEALSKKWGFDFCTGQPLENHDQYQWERVPPTSAPACFTGMVTITRVAHVNPQNSTTSENLLDQRAMRENGSGPSSKKSNKRRQPLITDFLQERKRPSSSASPTVAKKARHMVESTSAPSPLVCTASASNAGASSLA